MKLLEITDTGTEDHGIFVSRNIFVQMFAFALRMPHFAQYTAIRTGDAFNLSLIHISQLNQSRLQRLQLELFYVLTV